VFYCWRRSCGKKGPVSLLQNGAFREEISEILEKVTPEGRSPILEAIWRHSEGVLKDNSTPLLEFPPGILKIKPKMTAWKYLKSRRIDPVPLQPFVLQNNNYLMFPIYKGSNLVYYVQRKMYGAGPRYKNAKTPGRYIFVPYQMAKKEYSHLIIVEGVFDAINIWQKLKIPVIAVLGATYGSWKVTSILEYIAPGCKAIVWADPNSFKEPIQFARALEPFCKSVKVIYPRKKDPGEMNLGELRKAYE